MSHSLCYYQLINNKSNGRLIQAIRIVNVFNNNNNKNPFSPLIEFEIDTFYCINSATLKSYKDIILFKYPLRIIEMNRLFY